jgi:hypothetical protein
MNILISLGFVTIITMFLFRGHIFEYFGYKPKYRIMKTHKGRFYAECRRPTEFTWKLLDEKGNILNFGHRYIDIDGSLASFLEKTGALKLINKSLAKFHIKQYDKNPEEVFFFDPNKKQK